MNPWSGPIAYVGRPTVDGRTVDRLEWGRLPLPLMADGKVVGRIETVDRRPSGEVYGTGTIDREPGSYPIGVSLTTPAGQGRLPGPDEPLLHVSGYLIGAEVHDGAVGGAWPDAIITVTGEPVRLGGKPDAAPRLLGDALPSSAGVTVDPAPSTPAPRSPHP